VTLVGRWVTAVELEFEGYRGPVIEKVKGRRKDEEDAGYKKNETSREKEEEEDTGQSDGTRCPQGLEEKHLWHPGK
jgi:hypothetical protein